MLLVLCEDVFVNDNRLLMIADVTGSTYFKWNSSFLLRSYSYGKEASQDISYWVIQWDYNNVYPDHK